MAKSDAVWAIDIGQCALKALKCRPHDDDKLLTAVAFDFIEYPKILSQPDADPVAIVADAIKQFLSRNSVRGDRVYISVAGQNGLSRFIKLPPVESKKIPDIVKFEAKQQIPFPLDEVVYRHQLMAGGSVVEGFVMETEVGLFAMKRDQAFRALKPFQEAGIEVDCIQFTPLALYNFVAFDQMTDLPSAADYDPESPPDSVVLLSLGADTADLVVTNGFRIWQRSLPIGGNHFTKTLTKELKLTFASAELQKRNALNAEDAKGLFQAMRPVFNDLLTELTRSINYFTNLDKKAKIKRGVALGNAMKLPGLQRFLSQNLGFDLERVESFRGLVGPSVVDAPVFKENLLAFGTCYGLAIQALRSAKIDINLVPDDVRTERLVRAKKPWAVGAAAAVLLGITVNYVSHFQAVASVKMEDASGKKSDWGVIIPKLDTKLKQYTADKKAFTDSVDKFNKVDQQGASLLVSVEGRRKWLEIVQAVNACRPRDAGPVPADPKQRNQIVITSIVCQRADDLATWYGNQQAPIAAVEEEKARLTAAQRPPATPSEGEAAEEVAAQPAATPPAGPGWVFKVTGYHFHNADPTSSGRTFAVREFAVKFLEDEIPFAFVDSADGQTHTVNVPVKKLGIGFPALIDNGLQENYEVEADEDAPELKANGKTKGKGEKDRPVEDLADTEPMGDSAGGSAKGKNSKEGETPKVKLPRFNFALEFCWQEPPATAEAETPSTANAAPAANASVPEGTANAAPAANASVPEGTANAAPAAPTNPPGAGAEAPPAEGPGAEVPAAPATEPPATEPPATEPPATEPPATEPPAGGAAAPAAPMPPAANP